MARWEDLTKNEQTALRKLARGELREVSARGFAASWLLALLTLAARRVASLLRGLIFIEQGQGLPVALFSGVPEPQDGRFVLRGPWAALRLRRELAGTSGGSIARNLKVRHAYAVMIEELVQLELNRMQKIDHGRPGDRDVSRCQNSRRMSRRRVPRRRQSQSLFECAWWCPLG